MNPSNSTPKTVSARSKAYSYGSLLLLVLIFGALVMLSSNLLTGMRLDLTENKLYTLSEGTKNILHELQEPVNLYLFFSEEASRGRYKDRLGTSDKRERGCLDSRFARRGSQRRGIPPIRVTCGGLVSHGKRAVCTCRKNFAGQSRSPRSARRCISSKPCWPKAMVDSKA